MIALWVCFAMLFLLTQLEFCFTALAIYSGNLKAQQKIDESRKMLSEYAGKLDELRHSLESAASALNSYKQAKKDGPRVVSRPPSDATH